MEELDDFLDKKVSTDVIIEYYIAYIPEIIKLITPIAVLLSSLFTTGKLTNTNEITAMKASGMSMFQYLRPIFFISLAISLLSVYFNGWIVPDANKKKFAIRREYLENSYTEFSRANIVLQDGPQKMISINYFDRLQNHGSNATIYEFSDSTRISPIKELMQNLFRSTLYQTIGLWKM